MAQLVKLQDYISRYQIDLSRYPTQFVRLKKSQWERVKQQWESGETIPEWDHTEEPEEKEEKKRRSLFNLLKFKKTAKANRAAEEVEVFDELMDTSEDIPEEENALSFEPNIVYFPNTVEELKKMFLEQFFQFQMKWASSTTREKSYVDPRFTRDVLLRDFLQKLPDSFLLFYYPILKVKKAPVELDIVLLTPRECLCITVVEHEDQAVFVGNADRFWIKKVGQTSVKMLNPFIQLNRMEAIIAKLFAVHGVDMPVKKVLISRNGYFDYPDSVFNVHFVDKREYPKWMQQLRQLPSPMKHMQMRAAKAILQTVQTTSFNRDIWNVEKEQE